MTTERPYQKAMKLDEVLTVIGKYVGTRYDEHVVAALAAACEAGQIRPGTVRLRSQTRDEKSDDSVKTPSADDSTAHSVAEETGRAEIVHS